MPHSNDLSFRDFLDEFGVRGIDDLRRFPKFVQIETISGCNAGCTMCSVNDWARAKSAMSSDLFDKLTEELAQHSDWVEQVTLQLGGEPLLDKRLEQRIAQLKGAGIRSVAFTSNASLLDLERAHKILVSGVDVVDFSIDGATAQSFNAIRLGLSYEVVRDNVLRFIALRNSLAAPVSVRVRMVIQPDNAHELDAFISFWRPHLHPTDYVLGRFLNWWAGWREDLAGVASTHLRAKQPPTAFNHLPCLAPFSTIVILSDGRVSLCCLDYNAAALMGDVGTVGISGVWRGEVMETVRAQHLASGRESMSFCHDCHIFVTQSGFDFRGEALSPQTLGA